jgi:hypothetical protein
MKIEFTRAEVEAILLQYAYSLTAREFNKLEAGGYRTMPDTFTVSTKEEATDVE